MVVRIGAKPEAEGTSAHLFTLAIFVTLPRAESVDRTGLKRPFKIGGCRPDGNCVSAKRNRRGGAVGHLWGDAAGKRGCRAASNTESRLPGCLGPHADEFDMVFGYAGTSLTIFERSWLSCVVEGLFGVLCVGNCLVGFGVCQRISPAERLLPQWWFQVPCFQCEPESSDSMKVPR